MAHRAKPAAEKGRRKSAPRRTRAESPIEIIDFGDDPGEVITRYASRRVVSLELGHGAGEAHVYVLRFERGGEIGPHTAGFGQLLVAIAGRGWVKGADGKRVELNAGQAAYFARGTVHAKGASKEEGLTALMVQVHDLRRERR
jgi:quercetin dioxygenase-like cupin family protein